MDFSPTRILLSLILSTIMLMANTVLCDRSFYSTDGDSLQKLFPGIEKNLSLQSNWTGPQCQFNHSRWIGVTCLNGRVTELNLGNMNLSGTIQENWLLHLTELRVLNIKNNGFSGHLPVLSSLLKLQSFDFSYNMFSGSISQICLGKTSNLRRVSGSHNRLGGPIPPCLTNIPLLTELRLENNNLSGNIPNFNQQSLTIFNVSSNRLSGPIPNTTVFNSLRANSFSGNPGLCGKPLNVSCHFGQDPTNLKDNSRHGRVKWSTTKVVLAIMVPLIFVTIVISVGCTSRRKKLLHLFGSKNGEIEDDIEDESTNKIVILNNIQSDLEINRLLSAPAELLGTRNFGYTYKVMLDSGEVLAIKKLPKATKFRKSAFEEHMQLLGGLDHVNLVPVIAYFYSKVEKFIFYPYMPRGSLYDHLFTGPSALEWRTRLQIALGIARGLCCLEKNLGKYSKIAIPHGNLKTSNVLLMDDFEPALSHYGLIPFASSVKTLVAFRSPEYVRSKTISAATDVWSFGILILELLTGKNHFHDDPALSVNLPKWVKSLDVEHWLLEVLDLQIKCVAQEFKGPMMELLQLGLACTDDNPKKRPSLSEVMDGVMEIYAESDHRDSKR